MITHTGKVFHTTATDHHDGVLLQVVTLTRDVGVDLFTTPRRCGQLSRAGDLDLYSIC